jgi:hypothetical protein
VGVKGVSMFTAQDIKNILDFGTIMTSFLIIGVSLLIYFSETPKRKSTSRNARKK